MHMQFYARKRATQCLKLRHKVVSIAVTRAVVQVRDGCIFRLALQGFEPGEKRCNADAAGNPDLLGMRVAA